MHNILIKKAVNEIYETNHLESTHTHTHTHTHARTTHTHTHTHAQHTHTHTHYFLTLKVLSWHIQTLVHTPLKPRTTLKRHVGLQLAPVKHKAKVLCQDRLTKEEKKKPQKGPVNHVEGTPH